MPTISRPAGREWIVSTVLGRRGASSVCPQGFPLAPNPPGSKTSTAAPATAERVLMQVITEPAEQMFQQNIGKVQLKLELQELPHVLQRLVERQGKALPRGRGTANPSSCCSRPLTTFRLAQPTMCSPHSTGIA